LSGGVFADRSADDFLLLRTVFSKQVFDLVVVSDVERCAAFVVPRVHVRALGEKQFHHITTSIAASRMESCHTIVTSRLQIGTVCDQYLGSRWISVYRGRHQWGLPYRGLRIDIAAVLD